jgi:NAD(P)-dependent dehydrogenase (short-subunit alcohol dehydrogenase family)
MGDRLQGKVALVTGAGQGIGRACALRFAREGAHVVVNDIREEAAKSVVGEIAAAGGKASPAVADVSRSDQVDAMIKKAAADRGRLDVLMNNAAAPLFGTIDMMSDEIWRQVFATTLDATLYGMRAAIPIMVAQGRGSIINTASAAGMGGVMGLGAYGAAKAGVINLTRTAAVETAMHGVRVNAVCPGSINTPPFQLFVEAMPGGRTWFERQIPVKRIGEPGEIANVALFLASDEASYVTGSIVVADGGVLASLGPPIQAD